MSTDISNNDMLAAINKRFDTLDAHFGAWIGGPVPTPTSGPAPSLTGEPGADNKPFNAPPPKVVTPPIPEVNEMMATREKDWLQLGYQQQPTLRMWLNNLVRNWEMNGGVGSPDYVRDQLQGLAVAHMNQWLDTGTGVDVKAIITALVEHYTRWQKDNQK